MTRTFNTTTCHFSQVREAPLRRPHRPSWLLPSSGVNGGFTLIELMIAMALGLVVISGVLGVFISNQQSSRTNQAMGEIQDGTRIAFEFMSRDIRNAGLTGCGNAGRIGNVLNNGTTASPPATPKWWANWNNAIAGYDPGVADPAVTTGVNNLERIGTTSSLQLIGAEGATYSINVHNATAAPPTISLIDATSTIEAGDILVACDPDHATIFQATGMAGTTTISYQTGTAGPGNCSTGLGFPSVCTPAGTVYTFAKNSQITKLNAVDWYIGNNAVGGRSLYRRSLVTTPAAASVTDTSQEMVRNVTDMQITYLVPGNLTYVQAGAVANWGAVSAIQITLTLQSTNQHAGTNAAPITRTVTSTVTLRNRVN